MKIRCFLYLFIFLPLSLLGQEKAQSGDEQVVKFLTYNILAEPIHKEVRVPAILKMLEESDADIIGLQEVAPWFLTELKKQPWMKDYHTLMMDEKIVALRGLLIISKEPIGRIAANFFKSKQKRLYLMVETKVKGVDVAVATCHLDSLLDAGEIRAVQLDKYFKLLKPYEHAIFLGDFNFGDQQQPETARIPESYVDSWLTTNAGQKGYTWNVEKSKMARKGSFQEEVSRRIDRVLVRSKKFTPVKTEIIGDEEIAGHKGIFLSDHFGVISTMKLEN